MASLLGTHENVIKTVYATSSGEVRRVTGFRVQTTSLGGQPWDSPQLPPTPQASSWTGSKPPDLLLSAASASPSCSFSFGSSLRFLRGGQQTPHQQVRILPASSGTSSWHALLWPPHHPCAAPSALQCGLRPTAPSSPTPHLPPASPWPRFLKAVCASFPFYLPPALQLWPGFCSHHSADPLVAKLNEHFSVLILTKGHLGCVGIGAPTALRKRVWVSSNGSTWGLNTNGELGDPPTLSSPPQLTWGQRSCLEEKYWVVYPLMPVEIQGYKDVTNLWKITQAA